VVIHQQGSISLIQRRLKVGYSRAARLIDRMEQLAIVGPFTGSKAREVMVDETYLQMRPHKRYVKKDLAQFNHTRKKR